MLLVRRQPYLPTTPVSGFEHSSGFTGVRPIAALPVSVETGTSATGRAATIANTPSAGPTASG